MAQASESRELSTCVSRQAIGSVVEKQRHDLALLVARPFGTAGARRMGRDVEWCRALSAVRGIDSGPALEQTANSFGTAGANRTMQWRTACPVLVLDV